MAYYIMVTRSRRPLALFFHHSFASTEFIGVRPRFEQTYKGTTRLHAWKQWVRGRGPLASACRGTRSKMSRVRVEAMTNRSVADRLKVTIVVLFAHAFLYTGRCYRLVGFFRPNKCLLIVSLILFYVWYVSVLNIL